MPRRKLVVHAENCRDCQACALACSLYHEGETSLSLARLSVIKDMVSYTFNITVCHHCDDPACEIACPTGALAEDVRGVVVLDQATCIQCGVCKDACPYDAIVEVEADGRYLKCDLCLGRERPLCVAVCPVAAITFGEE